MISPGFFIKKLQSLGTDFFTGVPDSLLKPLCAWMKDNLDTDANVIAANEGGAMALAAGHYLASGRPACIYMQNSGIGNAVNPLLSLLDADVYGIPALLVVGWRGMPGVHDEPQHVKQGRVTPELFEAMDIPYVILSDEENVAAEQIEAAAGFINDTGRQMAVIVRKGTFAPFKATDEPPLPYPCREEALKEIVKAIDPATAIVSTTGMISRELFELRVARGEGHGSDFLTVGSMGHASQIALGIALADRTWKTACIDGDGAFLMHLGGTAIIGSRKPERFIHFVLNNGAHDSVGGQDTVAMNTDLPAIALACGYRTACRIESIEEISDSIKAAEASPGPHLIEIRVRKGARPDLGRPTTTPAENRDAFIAFLREKQNR